MSEYDLLKRQGQELMLGKAYEKAVPVLTRALEQQPDDGEVHFFLLIAKGAQEGTPSMSSEAYQHARRVVDLMPDTDESTRAMAYIAAADVLVQQGFAKAAPPSTPTPGATPGAKTPSPAPTIAVKPLRSKEPALNEEEVFIFDPSAAMTLEAPTRMLVSRGGRISPDTMKRIWQVELYPQAVIPANSVRELPKGTRLKIQNSEVFIYNLASWRAPVPPLQGERGEILHEPNEFRVAALNVLVEEADGKETKGWIVNQVEKFQDDGTWVVLVGNRLKLERGVPEKGAP
ncbi:MAG: hypothetical protein AB1758_07215 [Candidatus Eremiobacterota bacterium]